MRFKSKNLMSFSLMALSAAMVITSLKWPFRAALFPVVIGLLAFAMASAEFFLSIFEKEEGMAAEKEAAVDFSLSEDSDQSLAIGRTVAIFAWIIGFFLMIIFFGFPVTVPLFVFAYLKFQGGEKWGISLVLAVFAWGFFYGLFVWLLDTPFQDGLAQKWLGLLEIR